MLYVNVYVECIAYIGLPIIYSIPIVYVEHKLETYMYFVYVVSVKKLIV